MIPPERPIIQDRPPVPLPRLGTQWEVIRTDDGDADADADFDVSSSITGPGMQSHFMAREVAEAWARQDALLFGPGTIRNWRYTVAILDDTPLGQNSLAVED